MSDIVTSQSAKEKVCAVCKIVARHKCSACELVHYCSREHQKSDWKAHSKNCHVFKLVEDSTIGRHYVATRNIKIDELVLEENEPLLVIPPMLISKPTCLNCYVPLTLDNTKLCDNCGWTLCLDCTEHGPECELTMKYRKLKVTPMDQFTGPIIRAYDAICVMRAISLRDKNPEKYQKFLNLEDHCAEMTNEIVMGPIVRSVHKFAGIVKTFMKIDDLDVEEIARIIGIARINAFDYPTAENYKRTVIFYQASHITHDCSPNCFVYSHCGVDHEPKIAIRAIRTIPKGDRITINYTDSTYGTALRRHILQQTKFFDCACERCKDPTEFGTMFSAVKCFQKECAGFMLPPTFLVSKYEKIPDFVCNKCNSKTPSAIIDGKMEKISEDFSKLNKENMNDLKIFISKKSKILHKNHFLIFNAELKIADVIQKRIELLSSSKKFLKETIIFCKKLVSMLEILAPNEYRMRGLILSTMFAYIDKLGKKQLPRNPDEFYRLYKETKEVLTEAYRLLRHHTNEHDHESAISLEILRSELADMDE